MEELPRHQKDTEEVQRLKKEIDSAHGKIEVLLALRNKQTVLISELNKQIGTL